MGVVVYWTEVVWEKHLTYKIYNVVSSTLLYIWSWVIISVKQLICSCWSIKPGPCTCGVHACLLSYTLPTCTICYFHEITAYSILSMLVDSPDFPNEVGFGNRYEWSWIVSERTKIRTEIATLRYTNHPCPLKWPQVSPQSNNCDLRDESHL